jgi:uncharacterized membrane protein YkvA (DUF1232 family)
MGTAIDVVLGVVIALAFAWSALVIALLLGRPRGSALSEAVRLLPDTIRLLRSLAADRTLPRAIRVRLWLLFVYLAVPFDLIPDFIPVIGYADDAIIVALVLRSIIRRAGPDAVKRHWTGTPEGLAALLRVARLPTSRSR